MTTSSLPNKAIVVGASRGLGRGVAEALAAAGASVVAIARDAARLAELAAAAPNITALPGDATDEALADRVLRDQTPGLLVLVAGAMPPLASLPEQTWDTFSANWQVDTRSTFHWLRAALTVPMEPGGHVIVVSSGAALRGSPVSGGYAAAKRAQWFIADYAANESQRLGRGLKVHCLLPDLNPSTELGRAGLAAYAERAGTTPEVFARRFGAPLTPEIMGQGVVDLATAPDRYPELAYRIGGAGLAPLA